MTRPIVMDVIARDNASKTFKDIAKSQTTLAKQTDGLSKNNDNLRKSQLQLVAAQERYNKVAKDSSASAGKLASSQASLITAQQRVKKATDDAAKSSEQASTKTKRSFGGMGLAAAAAGVAAVGLAKKFVTAADEQRKANAQTAAVIKSTGGAANVTAKQIGELTGALAKQTGIQDDTIQSGANMLLTFTNIRNEVGKNNDVFNQATKIVTDMSVALGTDVTKSAIQVGKALNDPIKGITALTRVGVTFTQAQKDQIKVLVETGDTLGAQKIILQELNKEFGGSAAAQATAGDKMKVAWDGFSESMGNALLPILDKVFGALSGLLDVFVRYKDILVPLVLTVGGFAGAVIAVNAASRAWLATQTALNTVLGETKAAGLLSALGGMSGPVLAVAAAATAAFFAFDQLDKKWDIFTTHIPKGITGGIDVMTKSLLSNGGVIDDSVKKNLALTFSTTDLKGSFDKAGLGLADYTTIVTGNQEESDRLFGIWAAGADPSAKLTNGVWQQIKAFRESAAAGKDVALTQGQVDGALKGTNQSIIEQQKFLDENNLTVETATAKYKDAVTQAHTFTAELGYMSNALATQSGNLITAKLGALALTDAIGTQGDNYAATRAQIDEHGNSLKTNTANGRANYEWALQQIQAINQQAISQATATGSIKAGTDSLKTNEAALRTSMIQAGFTEGEVQNLIDTYAATPSKISTSIEEQGSAAVLTALGDILNQLHAIADPTWAAKFDFAMNNPSLKRGFARGGQIRGPGGPTSDIIPIMASSGEYVVNAAATQKHLGLLENINRQKYAGGGLVGDLNINTNGLASEWQQYGQVLSGALADAAKRAAAEIAKQAAAQAAKAGGIPGAPGSIPANVGAYQAYAGQLMAQMGMQSLGSLIALWNGESGWNPNALNGSSGAYGIPQALPADKMASAGADWHSNAQTQIRWGLGYIRDRYGSPDAAWSFWQSQSPHWYGRGMPPTVFSRPTLIGVGENGPETVSVSAGRHGAGVVVAPGAITVYAAPGMDARAVARQAFAELRRWVADEERKAAKGARA